MTRSLSALVEVGKVVSQRVTQAPELSCALVRQAERECLAGCHGVQRFEAAARHPVNFSNSLITNSLITTPRNTTNVGRMCGEGTECVMLVQG